MDDTTGAGLRLAALGIAALSAHPLLQQQAARAAYIEGRLTTIAAAYQVPLTRIVTAWQSTPYDVDTFYNQAMAGRLVLPPE